jgi:succinylglutamic semialdehyde dehydrogenase
MIQSINPWTQEIIGEVAVSSAEDVNTCFTKASKVFDTWSSLTVEERWEKLLPAKNYLTEHKYQLAKLITQEVGKPLWEAETEVGAMIAKFDAVFDAYQIRSHNQEGDLNGVQFRLDYLSLGTIGIFGPFNLPAHLSHGQILPALLMGNAVVFKPSPLTPLVGNWFANLWSHLPEGVFQLVQGGVATAQQVLGKKELRGLIFIGSYQAGQEIHKFLAGRTEVLLALEMGGNNPLIVGQTDSNDTNPIVYNIIQSHLITSGQRCVAARRLILPIGKIGDDILEHLSTSLSSVLGGDPMLPENYYGPLIHSESAQKLMQKQNFLKQQGFISQSHLSMNVLKTNPAFITPGLFEMNHSVSSFDDDEDFGPLLKVYRYDKFAEAIHLANDTKFGLCAGLISDQKVEQSTFYQKVRAGIMNCNKPMTGASGKLPFGGLGCSGNHRSAGYFSGDYCADPRASLMEKNVSMPEKLHPGIKL